MEHFMECLKLAVSLFIYVTFIYGGESISLERLCFIGAVLSEISAYSDR